MAPRTHSFSHHIIFNTPLQDSWPFSPRANRFPFLFSAFSFQFFPIFFKVPLTEQQWTGNPKTSIHFRFFIINGGALLLFWLDLFLWRCFVFLFFLSFQLFALLFGAFLLERFWLYFVREEETAGAFCLFATGLWPLFTSVSGRKKGERLLSYGGIGICKYFLRDCIFLSFDFLPLWLFIVNRIDEIKNISAFLSIVKWRHEKVILA